MHGVLVPAAQATRHECARLQNPAMYVKGIAGIKALAHYRHIRAAFYLD